MLTVNMLDAKTNLSRLVEAVESGAETEVILARKGKPVARLMAMESQPDVSRRIGLFKGRFKIPEPDPELDAQVARLFEESRVFPGQ